ncbi:dynamin family protein [Xanthobacter sp. V3C-3]|uniref:dynamin family protein n=1 Tax=Xanthobacter lutulentifluminis TaxID=3119935 RepID=UPI003729A439
MKPAAMSASPHVPAAPEMPGEEQRFLAEIDAAAPGRDDLRAVLSRLEDWLASLRDGLAGAVLAPAGLCEDGALARQVAAVTAALGACVAAWPQHREALGPALALARQLDGVAILLVFGKFNAGKSSLCNLIADRFAARGRTVGFFHVEAGQLAEGSGRFAEGATETTARLQGVRLGDRLVLLDTPGLHSATAGNAALTRRFADSADGVLWLTSSAAPGQVQELDELAQELRRAKPLLPVLTRSDLFEEDEIDGALVRRLRNKTAANRALQEADVAARARDKLAAMGVDPAQLRSPVSVSAHMARAPAPDAIAEAGLERLYAALRALVAPALAYGRRKPAEVLLRHLDETVLGDLRLQVGPVLAQLARMLDDALAQIGDRHEQVQDDVWRDAIPLLPELLEAHAGARDVGGVCRALAQAVDAAFARAVAAHLPDHRPEPCGRTGEAEGDGFADFASGGIGFEELAVEVDGVRRPVGIDYGRLHAALERQVRAHVVGLADASRATCAASLRRLLASVAQIGAVLDAHEASLRDIRTALRAGGETITG